jgi:glycosyltransferase involved in cell wall biosynthesis
VNKINPTVSVVIPTLGGAQLSKTIATINAGSFVPDEILVCIPGQYSENLKSIEAPNIRVICTQFMGQVAQRAEGFKQAREPLVMQIDDDIDLSVNALELMVKALCLLGRSNVVGPVFLNKSTGMPLSPFSVGIKGQLINIYYYLFGGLPFGKTRMGCLSSICVSSSIDPKYCSDSIVKTEWLAGGCVLGYREDLIFDNFFPFSGKAYAEDGLHSYLRSNRGTVHNVVPNARAAIDLPSNAFSWHDFSREMCVRLKIVRLMQGSVGRKIIYIIVESVRRMVWSIRHRSI